MSLSILERIKSYKLEEVSACKRKHPLKEIEQAAKKADKVRAFGDSLKKASIEDGQFGLIGEIKKASPSKGLIRFDFSPPDLARAYEEGGAACLSVLTDTPFFQGHNQFLSDARAACSLPVLRKDFFFDPYQVVEARALGADCILIIMAALSLEQARTLEMTAFEYGMQALIEVHNEAELLRAFELRSRLIGINNRDLNNFDVSLDVTKRLAKHIPSDYQIVSESGIFTHDDIKTLADSGICCFLVGESLMRMDDVTTATRLLLTGRDNNIAKESKLCPN